MSRRGLFATLLGPFWKPNPDTKWLGYPVSGAPYSGIDPGFFMGGPPDDIRTHRPYEIGLDPSGVVVWRPKAPGAPR